MRPIPRGLPWLACLAWLAAGLCTAPAAADWPAWLERWLFNADERTARGLDSLQRQASDEALAAMESALRLEGPQPLAQFNAGTARLHAAEGDPDPLLAAAAQAGSGPLAVAAHYNLGNARMERGDLNEAIAAFEQALRLEPGFHDAKYNLELARHLLEQQQDSSSDDPSQESQEGDSPEQEDEESSSDSAEEQSDSESQQQEPGSESSQGEPQDEPSQDDGSRGDERDNEAQGDNAQGDDESSPEPPGQDGRQRQNPLPQFRDLPDMTAEEAAAILEAIENMEREQRRREALAAAALTPYREKDW